MKVYVNEVYDHKTGKPVCMGIDMEECSGESYNLCMAEMKRLNDESRYAFFYSEENIDFQWDMTSEHFEMFRHPPKEWTSDDYLGSLFFGKCKLEFCLMQENDVSYPYCNMFVMGHDGYGELYDGTPYNDYEGFACMIDNNYPKRRTFDMFAQHIEKEVVNVLNEYTQLINDATKPTDPNEWYSIEHVYIQPTRRA